MREQRLRGAGHRRRLTLRGRVTLALLAALPLGVGALLSEGSEPRAAAPPVSAPPQVPASIAELLGRLPIDDRATAGAETEPPGRRLVQELRLAEGGSSLRVEYSLDVALSREIFRVLRDAEVELGNVVVLDPATGALLAYASTDRERFPPTAPYPAASLIKVVTAAATLESLPDPEVSPCRNVGSPSRLTRQRIEPPKRGPSLSLRRALATSNNQCFAQLAVHTLGPTRMLQAIRRFGLLEAPAPAHAAGVVEDPGDDPLALGKLGCGLAGCRITPLHAARLAATLADGRSIEPWWVASVRDAEGRELALPPRPAAKRVLSREQAETLRLMLVDTTVRGTARRAFRTRRGPLLQKIRVAGKTGSLSGREPKGRYEWFIGVAPADEPRIAIAVLVVYGKRWMSRPAQIAAEVLKVLFCPRGVCRAEAVERFRAAELHTVLPASPARAAGG